MINVGIHWLKSKPKDKCLTIKQKPQLKAQPFGENNNQTLNHHRAEANINRALGQRFNNQAETMLKV
jgi:hypothetical protein